MTAPVRTPLAVSVPVEGMTCASCVAHVEEAIASLPEVEAVRVNLAPERADVSFKSAPDFDRLRRAVEDAGYEVRTEDIELDVKGMSCASCVSAVEDALKAVPGVQTASVNLATGRAIVSRIMGSAADRDLLSAIAAEGYGAERHDAGRPKDAILDRELALRASGRRALVAAVLTAPIVVLAMGPHLVPAMHHWLTMTFGAAFSGLAQLVLAAAVLAGPGGRFFVVGARTLARRKPDMNALVAIGSGAAFLYSTIATLVPSWLPAGAAEVYFEAAALIVTLILLGRYLEARARGRASEAISRLLRLAPKTATVMREGVPTDTPVDRIVVGDVVLIRPGERIPVDGTVTEGSSWVDEAILTGESIPMAKAHGSTVLAGSINRAGSFSFSATGVGADTFLAGIVRLLEGAQAAKLPIQALIDRITRWFVPAVLGVAALTFLAWLLLAPSPSLGPAVVAAVAVLIVACPCAMGLATPISILVGSGRAAELGVLFRRGDALQTLSNVDTVAMDKTGTLTLGQPRLTDVVTADGRSEVDLVRLAASAESRSEHPLARAVTDAARDRGIGTMPPSRFVAEAGRGVVALVDGVEVRVGTRDLIAHAGASNPRLEAEADRLAAEGKSVFFVAAGGMPLGVLAVSDPLKPGAAAAVARLRRAGRRVVMITGDRRSTALAIAREAGIEDVIAGVTPAGKLEAIRDLRAAGRRVAFVGDGMNDAPALAEADVGIAMGTGTDVAIEAAEVVLPSGSLDGVPSAIAISGATLRNIRQNLFWAFAYNVALIPVAAGVLYPLTGLQFSPILAAGAMALSSVFVVANALRLRGFGSRPRVAPLAPSLHATRMG
ncbi:MAG: copper-translocating P-type ATPase [Bauldia sp.]|nr:copper-translocating P-type ATPase [Bauldia sp.]